MVANGTKSSDTDQSLRHVMVVGGSVEDWNTLGAAAWDDRIREVAVTASQAGVRWVTLLPCGPTKEAMQAAVERRTVGVDGVDVIVEPFADGRERFAAAIRKLPETDQVNEASVAEVLYEPADSEPDLVVVYGPPTQLPASLVWELAYAELVFADVDWICGDDQVLSGAIADFAHRRRRFGGLDD